MWSLCSLRRITFISGAFATLRQVFISFVMSVRPSLRLSVRIEPLGSHWTDFHKSLYFICVFFENLSKKFQISLNLVKINLLYVKNVINLSSYLTQFFFEWKRFQTKVVENLETRISFSIPCFRKSCRLWDKVEKYFRAGQATDDNTAHVHCMLDT